MVSHIVMWNFKEDIKADAFDAKMQFLHDKMCIRDRFKHVSAADIKL